METQEIKTVQSSIEPNPTEELQGKLLVNFNIEEKTKVNDSEEEVTYYEYNQIKRPLGESYEDIQSSIALALEQIERGDFGDEVKKDTTTRHLYDNNYFYIRSIEVLPKESVPSRSTTIAIPLDVGKEDYKYLEFKHTFWELNKEKKEQIILEELKSKKLAELKENRELQCSLPFNGFDVGKVVDRENIQGAISNFSLISSNNRVTWTMANSTEQEATLQDLEDVLNGYVLRKAQIFADYQIVKAKVLNATLEEIQEVL